MKITIKYIPNVLEKAGRKTKSYLPEEKKTSLKKYLIRSGFDFDGHRIILNGKIIPQKNIGRVYLRANDEVIITPKTRDPGTIFGIVSTVASFFGASAAVASTIGAVAALAYVAGTVAMIGYSIYSAFQQPKVPNFGGSGGGFDEDSPTYGWNGPQTSRDEAIGRPYPVIYGRHAYGGVILNEYVSQDGDNSYLNVLLCAAQGEIRSISEVKINGNPVENFSGVTVTTRMGTSHQDVIPNFEELHNIYPVGVPLMKNDSYVYTMINDDISAFEITLTLPTGLYKQDSGTGGIIAWAVSYRVRYKLVTSGVWIDLGEVTISAKSRSQMQRIFRKEGLDPGRYDIEVTRTSDDSSLSPAANGDLVLSHIDEIETEDLIHPNKALLGVRALATNQLNGSASFSFVVEGILVRVPDIRNSGDPVDWEDYYFDPDTEEYKLFSDDSVLDWDGSTYVNRWSANPVWCIRDLILNNRFGLGDLITSANIPDSQYLEMSQFCDRKVDDGEGGFEKLYRLDVVIDSSTKAIRLLNQLASVFDAFVFSSQDTVVLKIDRDEDPVQIFGMGNTYAGSLDMAWKSSKERYNLIDIQYIDKDKNYALDSLSIPNDAALAVEPLRRSSVRCYTTKQSYALRAGRRALNVARHIKRLFSFKAGIDAIACSPGDIIGFSHDTPAIGESGRIVSGSTDTSIKLDRQVTIGSGTYKIIVSMPDDTLEERTVTNSPGQTDTITVSVAFSEAPAAYSLYALGPNQIHYKKLRIFGLHLDNEFDVSVLCSEVNPGVYDYTAVDIPDTNYSLLSRDIPDVLDLVLSEMVAKANDGTIINTIEVWFRKPLSASYHINQYKSAKIYLSEDDGLSWRHVGSTASAAVVINDAIETGRTYKVAVVSVSDDALENAIADSPQASITIIGKAAKPSNVTGFDVQQQGNNLHFSWTPIRDGDLARYIVKRGTDWISGQLVAEQIDVTEFSVPIGIVGDQTYMIKAVDTSENESEVAAMDSLFVNPPPDGIYVMQIDPWAQNREYKLTGVDRIQDNLYSPYYTRDVFVLKTSTAWSGLDGQNWDGLNLAGYTVVSPGEIEQTIPIDLGVAFEFNLISDMLYKNVAGGSIEVQVSYSTDGTTFTAFAAISSIAKYKARYLKFKYIIATSNTANPIYFYAGTIYVNVSEAKKDQFNDVLVDIAGTHITFTQEFLSKPRFDGGGIINGVYGFVVLDNMDENGVDVFVINASGVAIGGAEVDLKFVGV